MGRATRLRLLAVLAVAGMLLAACSSGKQTSASPPASSGSSGASAAKTAAAPTGSPINVMTIAPVNYAGPNYDNIMQTAKLYAKWINAHGGIKGHPLHVTTCDTQGDPTKTAECGRQAIAAHDVALVGSFTINGNAIVPELAASHTAWFGICCAEASDELSSPDVQQIGNVLAGLSALAAKAAIDGCKKIAYVGSGTSAENQIAFQLVKNGLKSVNGPPLYKTVLVPITAQDYSPQVAEATNGTDCIIGGLAQAQWPSFMPPFEASGAHQRLYGFQGNLDITITKAFPQATQGAVVAGVYSDISLPAWKDYREAIAEYHPPSNLNYNSLGGLGTWAAYVAFNQIVSSMTGPITAANFLAVAQKATVQLNGMTASNVDFADHWQGLGGAFQTLVNRTATFDIVKNGKLVPFQNGKFYDMTNAMLGQPLSPANTPPAGD